ncbi:MAG: ABC transporter permease [Candidatus Bathyarchaeia archaeon]|jgi:putative ABC transport system permease protein
MKSGDVFSYAFGAIRLRKLRAGLTTLGVVIGIAAIVALLSISQGLQVTITNQLESGFATDTLIVSPGSGGTFSGFGGGFGGSGSDFSLMVSDTQIINGIDNVVTSAAIIQEVGYIDSSGTTVTVYVVGVDYATYSEIYSGTFIAESGTIPSNPSNGTVIVGKRVSDRWDNGTILCSVGDNIEIVWTNTTVRPPANQTYNYNVAAVLQEVGGFSLSGPSDHSVYIPIEQAQQMFGTNECDQIIVKLAKDDDATINAVSDAIREAFDDQVSVTSSTAVLGIISSVFSTIELFLAGIAAISLLVAGVGIMNIMIVSLMERTREIGILKALGMKSRTVLSIFISEAVIIGVLGAVFGIALGWVLASVAATVFTGGGFAAATGQAAAQSGFAITPVLSLEVLLGAFAFGIAVSVIFAIYPAWRASKLKPVDALRYE